METACGIAPFVGNRPLKRGRAFVLTLPAAGTRWIRLQFFGIGQSRQKCIPFKGTYDNKSSKAAGLVASLGRTASVGTLDRRIGQNSDAIAWMVVHGNSSSSALMVLAV